MVIFIIIMVPGVLIAKQPDLGTALQVIATGCGVIFCGLQWKRIVKIGILAGAAMPYMVEAT